MYVYKNNKQSIKIFLDAQNVLNIFMDAIHFKVSSFYTQMFLFEHDHL